jgi:hypothetical protein
MGAVLPQQRHVWFLPGLFRGDLRDENNPASQGCRKPSLQFYV